MPRIEKDFLGEKQLPDDAYYGVQTLRGKENFHITGMPVSRGSSRKRAIRLSPTAPTKSSRIRAVPQAATQQPHSMHRSSR